jgi:hypothetical protein
MGGPFGDQLGRIRAQGLAGLQFVGHAQRQADAHAGADFLLDSFRGQHRVQPFDALLQLRGPGVLRGFAHRPAVLSKVKSSL